MPLSETPFSSVEQSMAIVRVLRFSGLSDLFCSSSWSCLTKKMRQTKLTK
jgi:hypothetical protein